MPLADGVLMSHIYSFLLANRALLIRSDRQSEAKLCKFLETSSSSILDFIINTDNIQRFRATTYFAFKCLISASPWIVRQAALSREKARWEQRVIPVCSIIRRQTKHMPITSEPPVHLTDSVGLKNMRSRIGRRGRLSRKKQNMDILSTVILKINA